MAGYMFLSSHYSALAFWSLSGLQSLCLWGHLRTRGSRYLHGSQRELCTLETGSNQAEPGVGWQQKAGGLLLPLLLRILGNCLLKFILSGFFKLKDTTLVLYPLGLSFRIHVSWDLISPTLSFTWLGLTTKVKQEGYLVLCASGLYCPTWHVLP